MRRGAREKERTQVDIEVDPQRRRFGWGFFAFFDG
jgi:hypothetical protein